MAMIGADGARCEWRGDFFASELTDVRGRLSQFPRIERPFGHTITIFLAKPSCRGVDFGQVVRLRVYADLPDLSAGVIQAFLHAGPMGKLQIKHDGGRVEDRGPAALRAIPGGLPACSLAGEDYVPTSVRVALRMHFALTPGGRPAAAGQVSELHRLTLDGERHLFRVRETGRIDYLGEMGPRLEIKSFAANTADAVLETINADGAIRVIPFRSIELLYQSLLSDAIARASLVKNRELELKFDLHGELGMGPVGELLEQQAGAALLLPFPHRIERLRRYHVCRNSTDARGEYTIVETPAGRLSEKRKRDSEQLGTVILRRTDATFTTDRDGATCSVRQFCADNNLTAVNSFTKRQSKMPFRLPSGRAYLISLDRCWDAAGRRLAQLEVEYIGNVFAEPSLTPVVVEELETLGRLLGAGGFGRQLVPSQESKHAFFRKHAPPAIQGATMACDMNL